MFFPKSLGAIPPNLLPLIYILSRSAKNRQINLAIKYGSTLVIFRAKSALRECLEVINENLQVVNYDLLVLAYKKPSHLALWP